MAAFGARPQARPRASLRTVNAEGPREMLPPFSPTVFLSRMHHLHKIERRLYRKRGREQSGPCLTRFASAK